ncbi:MAG: YHS domain-containing (seleno)protein [Pseudomonadales bacterium]
MAKLSVKAILSSKTLCTASLLICATTANLAVAADEHNVAPGLTAAGAPLGLHGVDPVAAITRGSVSEGLASFTSTHDGVAYYFSDAATQTEFEKNPAQYVPQNGGFCTFGVSVGKKFDGDPNFASIVNGKLYVFLNEEIYQLYLKDEAGTIAKAEAQWQEIEHTAATAL